MELKVTAADLFFLNGPLDSVRYPSKITRLLFCVFLGMAAGWLAWDTFLPAALIVPVVWSRAGNKKTAWLTGLAYHLAASRGLLIGIPVFFGSGFLYGLALWFLAGFIQSLPYYFCAYIKNSYLAVLLLLIALIIPPIGVVAWANPLTAAGLIFPGLGFKGLTLTLLLIWFMIWQIDDNKIFVSLIVALLFLFPLNSNSGVEKATHEIKGVETAFPGNPENIGDKFSKDYKKFLSVYNKFSESEFKVLVLPESTGGIWLESTQNLWKRWQRHLKKDQAVVLPTLLPESKNTLKTYNSLILMNKDGFETLYKARQAVPIAMWSPSSKENVKTNWFGSPIFKIGGKKATALICYEAYLTWPVLHSFVVDDPEIILFVSNHWWSKNTSLLSIQKTCAESWAALFNVKLISAVNL